MKLVRGAWKILVAIKDGLVLIFMLLFFLALFAALSAKPNPTVIRDGALVVALDGRLSEQPEQQDSFAAAAGGGQATKEVRLRDVIRALDGAIKDDHVKAVVLDMDRFMGGYPAAISDVAAAVGRVRASGKKVLAYATAYTDGGYAIASNANEIWVHPMGGTVFMGPGGSNLYYKGLIDKLGVTAHIYKVGKYKSAVEPYARSDMSPEAREMSEAFYSGILSQWQAIIAKARPKAQVAAFLAKPDEAILAAGGDIPEADLRMGLVDKKGDRLAFGQHVAEIVGKRDGRPAGDFNKIKLGDWLAANPLPDNGEIGVITVAGEIVDGKAGPGTAGGDTVSALLLKGLAEKNLKALVVRVDSPGGSALASEQIRQAILQAKAKKIPVVVSMGGLAASGGYWVSTSGDTIFAEPNTITGSIGIFGVFPTFEKALAKIGVTTDGVKTTPLSGQPDVLGGTNEVTDRILQGAIDNGYARFVGLVAQARKLTPERVNEIGQGRVWIGGTAQQIGLVDRFGTMSDAVAEAAKRAGLDPAKAKTVYLEKPQNGWMKLIAAIAQGDEDDDDGWTTAAAGPDVYGRIALARQGMFAQALGDAKALATGSAVQARCLECASLAPAAPNAADQTLLTLLLKRIGL